MTPADIFNAPKINAATDAAIADHARDPHELPRVGTMVVDVFSAFDGIPCIVMEYKHNGAAASLLPLGQKRPSTIWSVKHWRYATPEQRRVAWGGEK